MQVSGGLHGVGISVVNALSEQLDVTVWRKGLQYSQSFRQGAPVGVLHQQSAQPEDAAKRGTELRFLFDRSVFSEKCASIAVANNETASWLTDIG
jgi:DNA gyrase subunit B